MKSIVSICLVLFSAPALADQVPMAFGEGGQIKMLYDRRQRPQSVYLNNQVHIVFNAGGKTGAPAKSPTKPMAITYDPLTRKFSDVVTLGSGSKDHHYGPVIWADEHEYLHVLFGCHKTPGTHLISNQPGSIGNSLADWRKSSEIADSISYPTVFRIFDNKQLVYYRSGGHASSWTYRLTDDNGKTWTGPANDVTDMDIGGRVEWSSYQTKLLSKDGRFLHVVFMSYDDVKSNDPKRLYNPRYRQAVGNGWKYNLYYVRVDLQTHDVTNFDGESMTTPIDIDQADAKCRIWDTKWRGAGVPPTIVLDEDGVPSFLHVLSGDTLKEHLYYYVRRVNGKWKQTPIADSNHQWNSCHLARDDDGTLHAYLIIGDGYLNTDGYMDKHGGGSIEEWTSSDKGNTWKRDRDLTPSTSKYPGWKFNNIQPVTRPDGHIVDGMLLFYGWKDKNAPEARAFLLHEGTVLAPDPKPDSPESVTALKELGAVLELNGRGTVDSVSFAVASKFTDDALAHLAGLKSMTRLKLDGLPVTDQGLKHLEKLPQLTWLRMSDTGVTDQGLVHLKNLTNLRTLSLTSTKITSQGLVQLKPLKNLQTLMLRKTPINDAGLEHVKHFPKLKTLRLSDTQVSDAGVVHLIKLKKLETLSLRRTKISESGLERLKTALPDCEITGP